MERSLLPDELQVGRFLSSRSAEIQVLCNELSKSAATGKLASQQVTRRMRRRAVSHNPKRLPRRLRESHVNQRNKGSTACINNGIGTLKKPSRRWRRRPKNLLAEYNRRQRNIGWLETHIWHAKRFHMKKRWSHAIPETPTDKSWRQTQRALSTGSVMWDLSYTKLIEMSGDRETLLVHLNKLTQPNTEKVFSFGPGEMTAVLFRPGQYPGGVVCSVSYLWRPGQAAASQSLWIWVHPGTHQQVLDLLIEVCQLKAVEEIREAGCDCKDLDRVSVAKLELKLSSPVMFEGNGIRLTCLDSRINRIRLRGPKTLPALQQCLIPENNFKEGSCLSRYFSDTERGQKIVESGSLFGRLDWKEGGNTAIGFNVRDPRLTLPTQRRSLKDLPRLREAETGSACELGLQESGLWSGEVRECVGVHRLSDHHINTARKTGDLNTLSATSVPVILISQPGGDSGWGSGWDLLLPQGWAMPFWMCLTYFGVRVGGQVEMDQFELEAGRSELVSMEDSSWARSEAEQRKKEEREMFFSLPPDKRPNLPLFGTLSPFGRDWDSLVGKGWFLVRDVALLSQLMAGKLQQENSEALVAVKLVMCGRGKLSENTMIFLPTTTDLETDNFALTEPKHTDRDIEAERKSARSSHQVKMKQLKRQWKRIKSKKTLLELSSVANDFQLPEDKIAEINNSLSALKGLREIEKVSYKEKSEKLWIPDKNLEKIKDQNARELVGWAVRGGYSLRAGRQEGLGIIKWNSLLHLVRNNTNQVLVKQQDGLQYRMAYFYIINN